MRTRLIVALILLMVLAGVIIGMARGFGIDVGDLISAWLDALGTVVFWTVVAGLLLFVVAVVGTFYMRRRSRGRARALMAPVVASSEAAAPTATAVNADRTEALDRLPDLIPSPRDFVPPAVAPRAAASGSAVTTGSPQQDEQA